MPANFCILKLQPDGSEFPIGDAESYNEALFEIELSAIRSPGKYVIRNRMTGQRDVLNLELKTEVSHERMPPPPRGPTT